MITGYNTDIQYEGVTYHVQTEDKGVETPLILSLVYDGGTILASKRSSYTDLLDAGFNESVLAERLQRQHKLICAAIRAGRIEDLKRMTMKESANKQKGLVAQREVRAAKEGSATPEPAKSEKNELNKKTGKAREPEEDSLLLDLPQTAQPQPIDLSEALAEEKKRAEVSKPPPEKITLVPVVIPDDEPIIDAVEIIEEEIILPADAVEIINEAARIERPADNKLKIEFSGEQAFKSGERKTLNIVIRRGNAEKGLSGAQVMVKILGSSFRPLIFHSKTDDNGLAAVHVQFPYFRAGRAAILVRATVEDEEVEIRKIIRQS